MIELEFSKIFVIESLRAKDFKTGQSLFNDIIKRRLEQRDLYDSCELMMPNSKNEFFECFEKIKNQSIYKPVNPIIHLEIHGNEDGLELNNNEIITWNELQFRLIEINVISKNNLFITMATCFGGHIYKVIKPNFRCPFWGFVGAFEEVFMDDILDNYGAFYDEFLQSLDFNQAVLALNYSNENHQSKFNFQNTQHIFNEAYKNYEQKYLTEEVIEKRLNILLQEAKETQELKGWSDEAIKKSLRYLMVDAKELLKENMMMNFFMWDIFPQNKPIK